MPQCHTLTTLIKALQVLVQGSGHHCHNVERIREEIAKWYPRKAEYMKYVFWNPSNPKAYMRNLVFANEHFDVILMCWPPNSESAIHDHADSSCWVALVEGEVVETSYRLPKMDRKFLGNEYSKPTGLVGTCTRLEKQGETRLAANSFGTTYVNNERGIHSVANRSSGPAYTLHVYAPGLRKMRLFKDLGEKTQVTVASVPPWTSSCGSEIKSDYWADPQANGEGIIDAEA